MSAGSLPADASRGHFSGAAALQYSAHAVSFGQRPSGSNANRKLQTWLASQLKALGLTPQIDSFSGYTPIGPVPMANIIVKLPGTSGRAIVLTGHYDTKNIPMVNFVGANDGGSSTGFLLEMARVLAKAQRSDDIYLVWLDGEEAVGQWSATDSCYGSRHLAQLWLSDGTLKRVKALLNIDMIGDKDLEIVNDSNSSASLHDLVWRAARDLGYSKQFTDSPAAIEDDHIPFVQSGINALDLIDFSYGPQNSWWHTGQDTVDKLSARSFQVVGEVVLRSLTLLQAK